MMGMLCVKMVLFYPSKRMLCRISFNTLIIIPTTSALYFVSINNSKTQKYYDEMELIEHFTEKLMGITKEKGRLSDTEFDHLDIRLVCGKSSEESSFNTTLFSRSIIELSICSIRF